MIVTSKKYNQLKAEFDELSVKYEEELNHNLSVSTKILEIIEGCKKNDINRMGNGRLVKLVKSLFTYE
tara:strand:- start:103 stop:306 length:204 start_codon:yes stop_codon:yes gene_type:complete